MFGERMPAQGALVLCRDGESARYEIRAVKGYGGSSIIYEAERGGLRCLIKELAPACFAEYTFRRCEQQLSFPREVAESAEYKSACADFDKACALMNRLAFSEATAEESVGASLMYGVYGVPYIVMEWNPLRVAACDEAGAMSLEEIVQMCLCLAKTLREYHEMGILHLDVKLSNILWSKKYRYVKLIDLGSAEDIGTASRSTGDDVFAAGAVLFEKLCGRRLDPAMGDRTLFLYERELRESDILRGCGPNTRRLILEILRRTICAAASRRYSDSQLVDRLSELSRLISEESIFFLSSPLPEPDAEAARLLMPLIPSLKKLVSAGSAVAVTSDERGGGKTELLGLYSRLFSEEYSAVIRIDCRRELLGQLSLCDRSGRSAFDEEEIRLEKLRLLTECDENTLFILDNFDGTLPANLLSRFLHRATCIAALSDRAAAQMFDSVFTLPLLEQGESRRLLRRLGVENAALAADIAQECGGNPALLRICAQRCTERDRTLSFAAAQHMREHGALFGVDRLPPEQLSCVMSLVLAGRAMPRGEFLAASGSSESTLETLLSRGWALGSGESVRASAAANAACSGEYRPDSALCRKMYLYLAKRPELLSSARLCEKINGADAASAALWEALGDKSAGSAEKARAFYTRAHMIYVMRYGADSEPAREVRRKTQALD